MKKEFLQNPDNRYRVVTFYPSLDNLKKSYAGMYKHYDGGMFTSFNEAMKDHGYTSVDELVSYTTDFLMVLNRTWHFHKPFINYGLQEISTGKIISRFYVGIYSYHPEQGYVVFRKEHDNDCFGLSTEDYIFKVVSLKTGKEYSDEFIERPTGLKDLCFFGYHFDSGYYGTFKIDETADNLREIDWPGKIQEIGNFFPKANNSDLSDFGIELIDNGIPFFKDPDFVNLTYLLKSLKGLIPTWDEN